MKFGPTAPKAQEINLLCLTYPPKHEDKKKYGREAQQTETGQQKDKGRTHGDSNCGLSVIEKIGVANVMVPQKQQSQGKTDSHILGFTTQQQLLEKKIDRATDRAKVTIDYSQVDKLEVKSEAIRDKINLLLEPPASVLVCDGASSKRSTCSAKSSTLPTLESILGSSGSSATIGSPSPRKKKKACPNPPPICVGDPHVLQVDDD